MLNELIGSTQVIDGVECLVSEQDGFGCLMFGPYAWTGAGEYKVEFDLAVIGDVPDASGVSAYLDVAAAAGSVVLATRQVAAAELSNDLKTIDVKFTLLEYRCMEFRVHTPGNGRLVAAPARLTKLADLPAEPAIDVARVSDDPFMLAQQVRTVLRLLRPQRAVGVSKVRLGNIADGGYICLDDFAGVDVAFSFGINDDISWDRDAADRGLTIYQFDHTVEDPAPDDHRFVFAQKMIAPTAGPGAVTIADLVRGHDKGEDRPNIFLKMDIENAEWLSILATPRAELSRFSQIVCELHYFQGLAHPGHRAAVYEALSRLNDDYAVVHVHANNYAGWADIANVILPCVMEVTFANRALFQFEETDEMFPTRMDASCDPAKPDMFLGAFRF